MSDSTEVQSELRYLREQNINLRKQNTNLRKKNNNLTRELKSSREIVDELLKPHNHNYCQARYNELLQKHNLLCARYEKLNQRICDRDCVVRAVLWICKKLGLGDDLCHRPVEKILFAQAGNYQVEEDDLRCENLVAILQKCGIVTGRTDLEFPREEVAKREMINSVWNALMGADGNLPVILLGRTFVTGEVGHVEVCDLDTRTFDGIRARITIHDPQEDMPRHLEQQQFISYLLNDEGLSLCTVDHNNLKTILTDRDSVHHTNNSNQTLSMETDTANDET